MENFLKKQREILVIIVYVVFVIGLIYAVIFPLLSRISDSRDKIQEEQLRQESSKKHLDELPKFKEQYGMLKDVDLQTYLLDKDNAVTLIEKLEALAAQSGNTITITVQDQDASKNVSVKSKKDQDKALINDLPNDNYLQLKILLDGNFNSIGKFVKLLESFEYNCDIVDMDISVKKQNGSASSNLFSSNGEKPEEPKKTNGQLEATLNTVFYAK